MDQGSLVTEQIEVGASFAREFDEKCRPVRAACWLKESEGGEWDLYLVSDQVDDSSFSEANLEVSRLFVGRDRFWLDPFHVKVRGVNDPVARDILQMQHDYPTTRLTRLWDRRVGNLSIDGGVLYPMPLSLAAAPVI